MILHLVSLEFETTLMGCVPRNWLRGCSLYMISVNNNYFTICTIFWHILHDTVLWPHVSSTGVRQPCMQLSLFNVYEIFSGVSSLTKNLHDISRTESTETFFEEMRFFHMRVTSGPSECVSIVFFMIYPYAPFTRYVSHVTTSKKHFVRFPFVVSFVKNHTDQANSVAFCGVFLEFIMGWVLRKK